MLTSKLELFLMLFGQLTTFWNDARINQVPGLMVAIDFEKAFDSLSWSFLYIECLKGLNFGDSFINWISVFYSIEHIKLCHKQWFFVTNV